MFQKSTKPIELSADIEIEASCTDVYAALNLRSAVNRYIRRGYALTPLEADGQYNLVMPHLSDLVITLTEEKAVTDSQYDIRCAFPPGEPVGILTGDYSAYRLTPLTENRCHLAYDVAFHTIPLSENEVEEHAAMLFISVHDDLARLKVMIEDSVEQAEKAGALDAFFEDVECLG